MSLLLTPEAIENYADQFANKVVEEAYKSTPALTGNDLLKLTPVKQVNIGILGRLAGRWEKTAEAFKSPYFDFGHPEVIQALRHLLNTASRHISIQKQDLIPLLKEATRDALSLLTDPGHSFEKRIDAFVNSGFSSVEAGMLIQQTHIHSGIAKSLLHKLQESPHESVSTVLAKQWLSELLESDTLLDPTDAYISQFSEVYPLNITPKKEEPVVKTPVPEKSFFDSVFEEANTPVTPKPVQETFDYKARTVQVEEQPRTVIKEALPTAPPEPEARPVVTRPVVAETVPVSAPAPKVVAPEAETINNRFRVEVPEVSDAGKFGHVQVKVENIGKGLSIGQRFMFINQLFNGNPDEFAQAIEELESAGSLDKALYLLSRKFSIKYGWNPKGDAETELTTIVKRRFA